MYETNGKPQSPRQTPKRARWSSSAKDALTKLAGWPQPVKLACVLMLLVLVALLVGCAAPSPPDAWPKNPAPPQLSEPIPQKSYSSKALQLIKSWHERLMGTPPM